MREGRACDDNLLVEGAESRRCLCGLLEQHHSSRCTGDSPIRFSECASFPTARLPGAISALLAISHGETTTGVTVHWMDDCLDTGDIAGQREIQFEDGVRGAEAEAQSAKSGGDLLAETLGRLSRDEAIRQPQPSGGTYYPAPSQDDFTLEASWHPRRAFNFMRATAEWGIPFSVESDGKFYRLSEAIEWQEDASDETPDCGKVWASFRGGSVLAVVWPD